MRVRWTIALWGCVAIIMAVLLGAGCGGSESPSSDSTPAGNKPVYEVSGLHPTYAGVEALLAEADVIAQGKALASKVVEGISVEDDPDGAPLSGLPMTEYDFLIEEVAKGSAGLVGSVIGVRTFGGETAEATYVVEGGQPLVLDQTYVLFLRSGSDGFYYPLAGDSAVATQNGSGDYELPAGVVGAAEATVPAEAIEWLDDPKPPSVPPSVPPPGSGPGAALPVRAPTVKRVQAVVKRGRAKLLLECQAGWAPCVGGIKAVTRNGKPWQVASARYAIEPGNTKVVKLRLNRRGKQLLAEAPYSRLPVSVRLDPDGETAASARGLLLRAPG